MAYFKTDIALVIILMISFNGFFLSFFFFVKSNYRLNPNYFLGLLLMVISSISMFQINFYPFYSSSQNHGLNCELLTAPFLFLYNISVMRPSANKTIYMNTITSAIIYLLFFLFGSGNSIFIVIVATILFLVNGIYLTASVYLLFDFKSKTGIEWKYMLQSNLSSTLVVNFLIALVIFISILVNKINPDMEIFLVQLFNGTIICYTYYKVLKYPYFFI
jgi:hypothetical protein